MVDFLKEYWWDIVELVDKIYAYIKAWFLKEEAAE